MICDCGLRGSQGGRKKGRRRNPSSQAQHDGALIRQLKQVLLLLEESVVLALWLTEFGLQIHHEPYFLHLLPLRSSGGALRSSDSPWGLDAWAAVFVGGWIFIV